MDNYDIIPCTDVRAHPSPGSSEADVIEGVFAPDGRGPIFEVTPVGPPKPIRQYPSVARVVIHDPSLTSFPTLARTDVTPRQAASVATKTIRNEAITFGTLANKKTKISYSRMPRSERIRVPHFTNEIVPGIVAAVDVPPDRPTRSPPIWWSSDTLWERRDEYPTGLGQPNFARAYKKPKLSYTPTSTAQQQQQRQQQNDHDEAILCHKQSYHATKADLAKAADRNAKGMPDQNAPMGNRTRIPSSSVLCANHYTTSQRILPNENFGTYWMTAAPDGAGSGYGLADATAYYSASADAYRDLASATVPSPANTMAGAMAYSTNMTTAYCPIDWVTADCLVDAEHVIFTKGTTHAVTHCLAYANQTDFTAARAVSYATATATVDYTWHISMRKWQKLMHALHGNGPMAKVSLVEKLNTTGMPILAEDATTAEAYLSWKIDFRGWCTTTASSDYIIGGADGKVPRLAGSADEQDIIRAKISQGFRYVCQAISNNDLRISMATQLSKRDGPHALKWLDSEILQGVEEQPALARILDEIALKPKESVPIFKARFCKFSATLEPKPAPEVLCAKYNNAILKSTHGIYDGCVTSAIAANDLRDFNKYAQLLTRLCTDKNARNMNHIEKDSAMMTELKALRAELKSIKANNVQAHAARDGTEDDGAEPASGRDKTATDTTTNQSKSKLLCINCGKTGHLREDCTEPAAKCTFTFGDGSKCGGHHLIKFCFFKDPSQIKDASLKANVERKISARSTKSTNGHSTELSDESDDNTALCNTHDTELSDESDDYATLSFD